MTADVYPPGITEPRSAILGIGNPALNQLELNYKTDRVVRNGGASLHKYQTGKFAAIWRNELTPLDFLFRLEQGAAGGINTVHYVIGVSPTKPMVAEARGIKNMAMTRLNNCDPACASVGSQECDTCSRGIHQ